MLKPQQRSINLDNINVPLGDYYTKTIKSTKNCETVKERWVDQSCVHAKVTTRRELHGVFGLQITETIENHTHSRRVPFHAITDSVIYSESLDTDDYYYDGGYDLVNASQRPSEYSRITSAAFCYLRDFHQYIIPTDATQDDYLRIFKRLRQQGASKQVAAERVACLRRRDIQAIKQSLLYPPFLLDADISIDFNHEIFSDSMCMIEDNEDCKNEAATIMAHNIAAKMTNHGYIITDMPEKREIDHRKEMKKLQYKNNVNTFNWE